MSCLSPAIIRYQDSRTKEYVEQRVRCRHCEDCKQVMRSSAFVRMHYEVQNCQNKNGIILFFTLTFADEYVPFKFKRMCFDKKYIQDWLQKFRQVFRRYYGYTVKYLIVSELGHVGTHRPHHHGILFLYPDTKYQLKSWRENGENHHKIPIFSQSYCKVVRDLWTFGKCTIEEFNPKRGGLLYIAKYISKDVAEDNLFKDIITRIQMKRGKSNCILSEHSSDRWKYDPKTQVFVERETRNHLDYLVNTFPSLFAFMNRYCPFTMISQGLGASADISRQDVVEDKKLSINGNEYNIPRYYFDRFVRKEVATNLPTYDFVCPEDLDKKFTECAYVKRDQLVGQVYELDKKYVVESDYSFRYIHKKVDVPNEFFIGEVCPPKKVLERCKVIDEYPFFHYENVPVYVKKFRNGKIVTVRYPGKASELSSLSSERRLYKFMHLVDFIETQYYSLPPILQDSCAFDVPGILLNTPRLLNSDDGVWLPTRFCEELLYHLDCLSLVASEWRAKSRIAKREQKRKEKAQKNSPYARRPLKWSEYCKKSLYYKSFNKFVV